MKNKMNTCSHLITSVEDPCTCLPNTVPFLPIPDFVLITPYVCLCLCVRIFMFLPSCVRTGRFAMMRTVPRKRS